MRSAQLSALALPRVVDANASFVEIDAGPAIVHA